MQLLNVPCPLIERQVTTGLVIDEMFRYGITDLAGILFTLTMNGVALLASLRTSALLLGSHRSRLTRPEVNIVPRPDMAIAYMQVSRLNR